MPRWLADGNCWIAGYRNADGWGICIADEDNVRRVADGYYRPRPSDDNMVSVVDNAGILFSLSLEDGSSRELWEGLPGNGRYGWVVDDNQLYFLAGGETGNTGRLMRRNMESGEIEMLYSGPMPVADTNLSIGKRTGAVLFTLFAESSDDLVVYENIGLK